MAHDSATDDINSHLYMIPKSFLKCKMHAVYIKFPEKCYAYCRVVEPVLIIMLQLTKPIINGLIHVAVDIN